MKTMSVKTSKFDSADYLKSDADIAAYLEEAFEGGETGLIAAALGDIAKAKGMTKVAKATGLSRESLYRSLNENGNPELATILKVLSAVGVSLTPKSHAL